MIVTFDSTSRLNQYAVATPTHRTHGRARTHNHKQTARRIQPYRGASTANNPRHGSAEQGTQHGVQHTPLSQRDKFKTQPGLAAKRHRRSRTAAAARAVDPSLSRAPRSLLAAHRVCLPLSPRGASPRAALTHEPCDDGPPQSGARARRPPRPPSRRIRA